MKILYFDCETTGLDPVKNGIIQIAGIVEVDGEEVEKFDIKIKPFESDVVEDKALAVSGTTRDDVEKFDEPEKGYNKIIGMFDKYINKYDKGDKFVVCGYNVRFDVDFLKEFFVKNKNPYLFAYIGRLKDSLYVIRYLEILGKIKTKNNKLGTVCEYFNINLKEAHNALADIEATKKLAVKMDKIFNGIEIER